MKSVQTNLLFGEYTRMSTKACPVHAAPARSRQLFDDFERIYCSGTTHRWDILRHLPGFFFGREVLDWPLIRLLLDCCRNQ